MSLNRDCTCFAHENKKKTFKSRTLSNRGRILPCHALLQNYILAMFWQFFAFFYIILFHYRVFNGSFSATATYIKHFSARGRNCSTPTPCHALQYVAAHALKNFITNPFVEVCDEIFEGVGRNILEGVAGCLVRTIPPPGGKMLDAGGGVYPATPSF